MKLLKRLLPVQDVDALLGDIVEEAPRRSRVWYWSQLLAVLVVGSWRDVRRHPLLALRATAVGFVSLVVLGYAFNWLRDVLTGAGFMWYGRWVGLPWYWQSPYSGSFYVAVGFWSLAAPMLLGWIIVRLHRAHGLTMLLAFRGAWALQTAAMVLWYAPGLFRLVFIQNFVIGSFLMLVGGCFATRRPDVA